MNVLPLLLLLAQLAVCTVRAVEIPTGIAADTKNSSTTSINGTGSNAATPATTPAGASTVLKNVNSTQPITKLTEVAKDKAKDTDKSEKPSPVQSPEKPSNDNNNSSADNGAAHRSRNIKKTETPTVQSATSIASSSATVATPSAVSAPTAGTQLQQATPKADKKLAEGGTTSDVIGTNSGGTKISSNSTLPNAAQGGASNSNSTTVPAANNNSSSSSSSTSSTTTTSTSSSSTTTTTTTTSTTTTTTTTTTTPKPLPAKPSITKGMSVPIEGEKEPNVNQTGTAAVSGNIDASVKPDPLAQPVQDMSLANRTGENEYIVPLVTVMLTVPLAIAVFIIVYRRFRDLWSTRHYRRMDFLVDGMYND